MASIVAACRASARVATRRLPRQVSGRGFRTSAAALAAQNFSMPALSPTMTEGNISTWRVKEGDKFVAGDVLLEIETDKATMDVEAQEDGVLVKIMQTDGSKNVVVGTRIAVLAEEGDDIASLEIPPDNGPKQEAKPADASATAQPPEHTASIRAPPPPPNRDGGAASSGKKARVNSFYPLYPSVAMLLAEHGVAESAAADMTPTGPNGRLLKGDVLAHLGKIDAKLPADIEARFDEAAHLDLSNVKAAANRPGPASPSQENSTASTASPAPEEVFFKVPISDSQFFYLSWPGSHIAQRRANLGLPLPLDAAPPSTNELFNQVLGLGPLRDRLKQSNGSYKPQVSLIPVMRKPDIIEELASKSKMSAQRTGAIPHVLLRVPQAEKKRAKVFLDRLLQAAEVGGEKVRISLGPKIAPSPLMLKRTLKPRHVGGMYY